MQLWWVDEYVNEVDSLFVFIFESPVPNVVESLADVEQILAAQPFFFFEQFIPRSDVQFYVQDKERIIFRLVDSKFTYIILKKQKNLVIAKLGGRVT